MPATNAEEPSPVLKPNPKNNVDMFKIFQNVQFNVVQHKKYIKEMIKLYKKLDEEVFRESFKNALHYLFTFGDTSAYVDRVVQFVASFCTSLDDEEEFLMFIFDIIFEFQCVSGQSVRYRASQLLAAVLSALGEDASLDDDLCDKLLASQMQRIQDTRGAVRCRAALALQRLQNPGDPDDEVTRAYRFHMSCDPSSSVRRAVVMSIAKCTGNVPYVLQRLCDVDEAVRRAAFLYVSAMKITYLRVRQRVLTLKVGLTERSARVRRVVEEILIPGWLSEFKGNIVDLLKAIRLDNPNDAKDSQYVAGKLLECLFKRLPISELLEWLPTDKSLRLISGEKLNKETAWYWRHLAEHLQSINDEETLESVLPDLVMLIGYIRTIVESPCPSEAEDPVGFGTRQYVLHELASMLRVYDVTDPAGRTALQTLITDVLTGDHGPLSADVIRAFVSALEMVVVEVSPRMEIVSGVLSTLRDPPEADPPPPPPVVDSTEVKLQRARLRVSLNVAIEAQEEAVRDQNYALAAECKSKVEDIQMKLEELNIQPEVPPQPLMTCREQLSDAATLTKCLTILNCALDTPQLKTITPMLRMIFKDLEVDIFQNPEILDTALQTVALYGMLDKDFANENKSFFFANLIDLTNEPIVSTALKCIIDLLCVHGARVFEDDAQATLPNDSTADSRKKRNTHTSADTVNEDGTLSESSISMTPDHSTVIKLLLSIMDSACVTYRLIIVEGLCRLLHLGHLESPSILSRLLLLWFNPATVDEDMLRQTIGVFFQTFPLSVDGAQEQIQKATLPTLRALANAPSNSPLVEIDQEAVVRFLVSLTRVNCELVDSQGAMATVLCAHLMRGGAAESGLVCRMLALLAPPRDARQARRLLPMLRDLCLKLPDKQSCRNLTKYLAALEALEQASLNKISNIGMTDGSIHGITCEESLPPIGRFTTSLPQPIARSTHMVINETVEEEVEIDETSPNEVLSRISEGPPQAESTQDQVQESCSPPQSSEKSGKPESVEERASSDSPDVSPIKKAKRTKGKKNLSTNRKNSDPTKTGGSTAKETARASKAKDKAEANEKGVKRSRSQRSVVDVDRAKALAKAKQQPPQPQTLSPPRSAEDLDVSNVTVRQSRGARSGSSTDSGGSGKSQARNGKAQAQEKEVQDLDVSNVTVRQSRGARARSSTDSGGSGESSQGSKKRTQGKSGSNTHSGGKSKDSKASKKKTTQAVDKKGTKPPARVTRSSVSSNSSACNAFDDSDDTVLHTIVYDKEFEQEILNDSTEIADSQDVSGQDVSARNVTIPETPDGSEESDPEPESAPRKGKGRKGQK